jgi:polar amino acid transport system permease protein
VGEAVTTETGAGQARPPSEPPTPEKFSERLALASARVPFRLKLAVVWLAIFALIGLFLSLADLDWTWIQDNWTYILKGLPYTIFIAVGAIILAVILALVGALGRLSKNPIAYGVAGFYTSFFRGTPLLVQLFLIYLALPQIALAFNNTTLTNLFTLTAVQAGILGLGLNYGAYMTEIFRAGIQSVGHGQAEAADALGMAYRQKMRRVVLPQAVRVIIPPTGNEFIAMMKDTALVSTLGIVAEQAEMFRRAQLAGKADFRNMEAFLIAAAFYWILTGIFSFFQRRLETRMSKGYVRGGESLARPRSKFVSGSAAGGTGSGAMMVEVPSLEAEVDPALAQPQVPPTALSPIEEEPPPGGDPPP